MGYGFYRSLFISLYIAKVLSYLFHYISCRCLGMRVCSFIQILSLSLLISHLPDTYPLQYSVENDSTNYSHVVNTTQPEMIIGPEYKGKQKYGPLFVPGIEVFRGQNVCLKPYRCIIHLKTSPSCLLLECSP